MAEAKNSCSVVDSDFLDPCDRLRSNSNFRVEHRIDMVTRKPSRSFAAIGSRFNQTALNFCPFCGERIDAMFYEKETAE